MNEVSFGIKTTQVHVDYADLVRVWREADEVPVLADAWLWDHLVPIIGPPTTPGHEGWTLLAALAAQTSRIRLGTWSRATASGRRRCWRRWRRRSTSSPAAG